MSTTVMVAFVTASCGGSAGRRWTLFLLTVAAAVGCATASWASGSCFVGLASFLSVVVIFGFDSNGLAFWSVFPLAIPIQRR